MFKDSPFYHASIRKLIIAFGMMFSNIEFERKDLDGNIVQRIKVPVSPGNKEKWIARLREDPTLAGTTQVTLPRIGFELAGFRYDASRALQQMNSFGGFKSADDTTNIRSTYSPVPYSIDFQLYVVARTQGDALQIIEQILPYFAPQYTITIDLIPEIGLEQDVPFSLVGVSMQDDFDGPFEIKRTVTYVLSFSAAINLYGPARGDGSTILHTRIGLGSSRDKMTEEHSWDAIQKPDGSYDIIDGGWEDLE